jgi:hypothetical protein
MFIIIFVGKVKESVENFTNGLPRCDEKDEIAVCGQRNS